MKAQTTPSDRTLQRFLEKNSVIVFSILL